MLATLLSSTDFWSIDELYKKQNIILYHGALDTVTYNTILQKMKNKKKHLLE